MGMSDHWQKAFLMWAKTDAYLTKVDRTESQLRTLIKKHTCYVAFSGGKDSITLLHIALQIDPNIPVFHWDYGIFMPRVFEIEIQSNLKLLGAKNVFIKARKSKSSSCKIGYQEFFGSVARFKHDWSFDVALIGLRKEEGCKRTAKIKTPPKGEIYPIADWKWMDIWAYIVSRNLPYPRIYDKYAELLGYDKVRLVTFFDMEFEKYGSPYLDGFLLPEKRNDN